MEQAWRTDSACCAVPDGAWPSGGFEVALTAALPAHIALRPALPDDERFVAALFRDTRAFLYTAGLPECVADALVAQQRRLQAAAYAERWPAGKVLMIETGLQPVGKLMLDVDDGAVHLIDLALMSSARGHGYGSAILRALQSAVECWGRVLTLSVDRQNLRAKNLYRKLGFQVGSLSETHESMAWQPFSGARQIDASGPKTSTKP